MFKRSIVILVFAGLALFSVACSGKAVESTGTEETYQNSEDQDYENATVTPSSTKEENEITDAAVAVAAAVSEIKMVPLPEGITGMKAESAPNEKLKELIIEYYEIPEDFYETTRYYYNYVDLNADGTDEIFAIVMGPYTSGTGGSSALWVIEKEGELHVNQDFTIMNTPIVISDTMTNGAKEIIVPYYGGGAESQYSVLTCSDGFYQRVADGKLVASMEGITGTAIIANDLYKEMEAGVNGLTLSK